MRVRHVSWLVLASVILAAVVVGVSTPLGNDEDAVAEAAEGGGASNGPTDGVLDDEVTLSEPAPMPSLWGLDGLGVATCRHISADKETEYEFDTQGSLVRLRTWARTFEYDDQGPIGDGTLVPSTVMRWQYLANGEVRRDDAMRLRTDVSVPFTESSIRMIPRTEGAWTYRRWLYADEEEERRYWLEDDRLVAFSYVLADGPGLGHTCSYDPDGRPQRWVSDDDPDDVTTWQYEDGALASITDYGDTVAVTRGEDGAWLVGEERYVGDCTEVVFWKCSATLEAFPDSRLPNGLLPL